MFDKHKASRYGKQLFMLYISSLKLNQNQLVGGY